MWRLRLQVWIPMCKYIFNACVVFAQMGLLFKIVFLLYYLSVYVSKLPCGTHTKSNWKWIPKYVDCDVRKRMYKCCFSVKHTQSSNYLLMKKWSSVLSFTLSLYYLWCIGEARNAREAGIYFIFPWPIFYRHSDLKVLCLNLTTDKQFYLQKHIPYNCFCFTKYTNDIKKYELLC
jgi:hypothetical protein